MGDAINLALFPLTRRSLVEILEMPAAILVDHLGNVRDLYRKTLGTFI